MARSDQILLAGALASLVALSCAPGEQTRGEGTFQNVSQQGAAANQTDAPGSTASAEPGAPAESSSSGDGARSECLGKIVPPSGEYGAAYIQEPAFSRTEEIDTLQKQASTKLRDRICQGILCSMIEQNIKIWRAHESGGYRCVMAVIKKAHVDEWKKRVETQLHDRLTDRALPVIEELKEAIGGRTPRVTLDKIDDHNIPGGPRSAWLHTNLQTALQNASAHVVPLDPSWKGMGVPNKVDGVVSAQILSMGGTEATLEVLWKIETADRVFAAEAVRFPAAVAPEIDESTYLPDLDIDSDKVSIHFDARDGGGLCHGQKTELWLETSEDLHVRVINLYGKAGGTVIFPVQQGDSDLVKAGKPVSLGEFEAMKVGDIGVERFLVLASPTKEGLGKYAYADHFCRLMPTLAQDLQYGRDLPSGKTLELTQTGFRLMSGKDCQGLSVDESGVEAVRQALRSAPKCWAE